MTEHGWPEQEQEQEDLQAEQEQEDLQADHEDGLHVGDPQPDCWSCWDQEDADGDNPESPGS